MDKTEFTIRDARWPEDIDALRAVRTEVFIHEQAVSAEEEWDGIDPDCEHVLAFDSKGRAIGTGRLLPDGHIGRMAVVKAYRGCGVGAALLKRLIERARERGMQACALNSQTHALGFYGRFGFEAHGEEFLDAGIPHRHMTKKL